MKTYATSVINPREIMKKMNLRKILRTAESTTTEEELEKKMALGRPLRIKYGVDVTAPFLHIGHAVNLWMMREFQNCGHKVVFLIGDFTTKIGDPTDKLTQRSRITQDEIETNAERFLEQASKVLLTSDDVFEIRRNSEWYDKMSMSEFFHLISMTTYAKLIQRNMFQVRIKENREIFMHEMLYPILQGYDSFELKSDLTIVGNDQLFNELMGRYYQEKLGQKAQVVMTSKITPGTDGKAKQSKSIGNYIAITDTSRDQFGKIMSIPDALIIDYLRVYTDVPSDEIDQMEKQLATESVNPMDIKKCLAEEVVKRYYGDEQAKEERTWFDQVFSKRNLPTDIPEIAIHSDVDIITELNTQMPSRSKTALRKLAQEGGIRINDEKMDLQSLLAWKPKTGDIIKIGKKNWFKISLADLTSPQ